MPPSLQLSPWYAVNLALLFPGVGHVYGGKLGRGLLWFFLGLVLLLLTIWSFLGANGNIQLGAACLGMGLVLWVFSVIDAHSCLDRGPKQAFRSFSSQTRQGEVAKDVWFAVFLSQLLPGLGHLQAHRLVAGAMFLVMTLLALTAAALFWPAVLGLGSIMAIAAAQLAWQLSVQPVSLGLATAPDRLPVGFVQGPGVVQSADIVPSSGSAENVKLTVPIQITPEPGVTQRIVRQGLLLALLILLSRSVMFGSGILAERWVEPFAVPSESMVPTLQVGDRILVAKARRALPQPGEVIVFHSHYAIGDGGQVVEQPKGQFFVKRLIALGGDRLRITRGQLWVNDQPWVEPYLAEPIGYELPELVIPPGQLFVLGDNRNFSFDSHVWGTFPVEDLVGRAYRISWPLERNRPLS